MSTIGKTIHVKGELRAAEDLTLEGRIEGHVLCEEFAVVLARVGGHHRQHHRARHHGVRQDRRPARRDRRRGRPRGGDGHRADHLRPIHSERGRASARAGRAAASRGGAARHAIQSEEAGRRRAGGIAPHVGRRPSSDHAQAVRREDPDPDSALRRTGRTRRRRRCGSRARPVCRIVDLGVGTGALTKACLGVRAARARLGHRRRSGDDGESCRSRLGRAASRVTLVHGSFLDTPLPRADADRRHLCAAPHQAAGAPSRRSIAAASRRSAPAACLISGDCAPASDAGGLRAGSRRLVRSPRPDVRRPGARQAGVRIVGG